MWNTFKTIDDKLKSYWVWCYKVKNEYERKGRGDRCWSCCLRCWLLYQCLYLSKCLHLHPVFPPSSSFLILHPMWACRSWITHCGSLPLMWDQIGFQLPIWVFRELSNRKQSSFYVPLSFLLKQIYSAIFSAFLLIHLVIYREWPNTPLFLYAL